MQRVRENILDILFPISCIACGKNDQWLCKDCADKITLIADQVCPLCQLTNTPVGRVCFSCKTASQIDGMLICSSYKNTSLSKAIHLFKYRFVESLGENLGKILEKSISSSDLPLPEIIIPVPLHPRRLRWRGFNQAEILARHLSENIAPGLALPFETDLLERKKYTDPQMKIKNSGERKRNIKNAFALTNSFDPQIIKNKRVLLVDDIATTGATLFECSKVLKNAGAKEVFGIVIARQGK